MLNEWNFTSLKNINICSKDIHFWRIQHPFKKFNNIDNEIKKRISIFEKILTEEELKKAYSFYKEKDCYRHITARGALKLILSHYLNENAKNIQFFYSKFTKPFLPEDKNPFSLQFNITHSGDWIAFAFTRNALIGVDIEEHKSENDLTSIAKLVFSKDEFKKWFTMPQCEKIIAFYNVWCSKEAILKGIGTGLSYAPDNITVSIDLDKPFALLKLENCEYESDVSNWELGSFYIDKNYSAAFATRQKNYTKCFYEWNWEDLY